MLHPSRRQVGSFMTLIHPDNYLSCMTDGHFANEYDFHPCVLLMHQYRGLALSTQTDFNYSMDK